MYKELVVTMLLQVDLAAEKSYEYLSRIISQTMLKDPQLKEMHGRQGLKGYSFCNLYPLEKDKIYKKNRAYLWHIRSFDVDFLMKIKYLLSHMQCGVVASEIKTFEYKPISRLKTLTPIVLTVENKSWVKENGIKIVMERTHINALKKYRTFIGEMAEPQENFIEYINLLNEKPIKIPYKNNSFLGHKVEVGVKSDKVSQKLALAAIGAGMLEKNSIGFGYCLYE